MSGFWNNVSGKPEDAFNRENVDVLPNGTMALAKILKASNESGNFGDHVSIEWLLADGQFIGHRLYQKIYIYDGKPERQLKARNMLKFIIQHFKMTLTTDGPPSNVELMQLTGASAGLKIGEYQFENDVGKLVHGNNILEIWSPDGFVSSTGKYREFKHKPKPDLSANTAFEFGKDLNDSIPF